MSLNRRGWALGAGVAAAAAAAGAGWALWRQSVGASPGVEGEFWSLAFDTPDGKRLALADHRGRPLVLNFWATWCPPCVREMPALDRFQRDFAATGWHVVGLAADELGPVREFLTRTPVSFPIGLAGFGGVELSRRLGNLSGGLPFTLVFGLDGTVVQRHMGETSYDQLATWSKGVG
jgi:thiol-disulfide isomerase/thioredoxin